MTGHKQVDIIGKIKIEEIALNYEMTEFEAAVASYKIAMGKFHQGSTNRDVNSIVINIKTPMLL
jgi:hypothetical protein